MKKILLSAVLVSSVLIASGVGSVQAEASVPAASGSETFILDQPDDVNIPWKNVISFPTDLTEETNPDHRMAHNIYSDPVLDGFSGKYTGFLIDFKADYDPVGTYWALCNWGMDLSDFRKWYPDATGGGAYAGFQNTVDGRKSIMSFWEVQYTDTDGSKKSHRAKMLYPNTRTNSFGGEGEGSNYIGDYDWKGDQWYRMYLGCYTDPVSGHTLVEQWAKDIDAGEWKKLCVFDTGLYNSCIRGGLSQFMEDYQTDTCCQPRSFEYKNIYVREAGSDSWKPVTRSCLSVDTWYGNKKGSFSYGGTVSRLYGITIGKGTDKAGLNEEIHDHYDIIPDAPPETPF
ncbi:MAG: DUF3472 domain-containing protein [Lachnospiraceae bacterium]|nr:DUF3472 domain-containing protein [Lachnospiraceae bacterium]